MARAVKQIPIRAPGSRARGFTLFEAMVAMFILLVGLLGVVSVFSMGMQARLFAQELVISQELASMWSDWIRFRLNETPSAGAPQNAMTLSDLQPGRAGDFYADSGSFHGAAGSLSNLPTYHRNAYRGYVWEISAVNRNFKPEWLSEDGSTALAWDLRRDGAGLLPAPLAGPADLAEVELSILRGSRRYKFKYVFSGVGMKYGKL